jgi:hypothetical protein
MEDVFRLLPRFKPQELTNVLRAMAVLNMKVPEVRKQLGSICCRQVVYSVLT